MPTEYLAANEGGFRCCVSEGNHRSKLYEMRTRAPGRAHSEAGSRRRWRLSLYWPAQTAIVPSTAYGCFYANGAHCYALSEWNEVSVASTLIDAHTSLAVVPEGAGYHKSAKKYISPREQDEAWTLFASDPRKPKLQAWIEVGDTAGGTAAGWQPSPIFFEASQSWYYPTLDKGNFTEVDFPEQHPGTGWWDATTYTENQGSWCATIQEVDLFCFPGLEQYSSYLQGGLEFAANNNPEADEGQYAENQGQVIGYATNPSGEAMQWVGAHLQYDDAQKGDPWPPGGAWGVCGTLNALGQGNGAITVEAPAWLDWPDCTPAPLQLASQLASSLTSEAATRGELGDSKTVAAAGKTSGELLAAFGAPKPTAAAPFSDYSAPSSQSATLSEAALRARALEVAETYGGEASPSNVRAVMNTPLGSALTSAMPHLQAPQSATTGLRAWEQSDADIVSMDGEFVLESAPRPPKASAPTGRVLTLALDAHTGAVDAVDLGTVDPVLGSVGSVHTLESIRN